MYDAFAVAFSAFVFFKNISIKPNKFINAVASTTFGVFLIHANSAAMRTWLWKDAIGCVASYNYAFLPLYAIASVIIIFSVCSFIDYLRIKFIEKPFFAHVFGKIENKLTKMFTK